MKIEVVADDAHTNQHPNHADHQSSNQSSSAVLSNDTSINQLSNGQILFHIGVAFNPKKTVEFTQRQLLKPQTFVVNRSEIETVQPINQSIDQFNQSDDVVIHVHFTLIDTTTVDTIDDCLMKNKFDCLLIKLTDRMARMKFTNHSMNQKDKQSLSEWEQQQMTESIEADQEIFDTFMEYSTANQCPIIDSFQSINRLIDREFIQTMLDTAHISVDGISVKAPSSLVIDTHSQTNAESMKESVRKTINFPVMCKSLQSCGSVGSHTFRLIGSGDQWNSFSWSNDTEQSNKQSTNHEWLVQSLIKHSGTMYKVYVMGKHVQISLKQSIDDHTIKQLIKSREPFLLNTQTMSITNMDNKPINHSVDYSNHKVPEALQKIIHRLASRLGQLFGLSLFGFDVIIPSNEEDINSLADSLDGDSVEEDEDESKECKQRDASDLKPVQSDQPINQIFIVDVNYFPSYHHFDDLPAKLAHHCFDRAKLYFKAKRNKLLRELNTSE